MSGFGGQMREYRQISLDRFDKANLKSTVFFLSHCHRDHMVGLGQQSFLRCLKSREGVFLYCSDVTRLLLLSEDEFKPLAPYIRILDLGVATTVTIPDSESKEYRSVVVTTLPAGHCPGSVMFLIEGKEGRALYTGDFRWEKNYATTLPALCVNGHMKEIDSMYVDTTFCVPEAFHIPSRDDCLSATASLVVAWLRQSPHRYVHVSSHSKYGHEPLLSHLAKEAQTQVHTSKQKVEVYEQITEVKGVFTCDQSARIHACTWQTQYNSNSRLPCGFSPAKGDNCQPPEVMVIRPSTMWFTAEPLRLQELVVSPTSRQGIHRACYSFHSSYSELRDLISLLRPRQVYPNVLPASDTEWRQVKERVDRFLKYNHKQHMTPAGDTTIVKPLGLLKRRRTQSAEDASDSEGLVFDSPEKKGKQEDSPEKKEAKPSSQKSETSDILSPAKSDAHSSFHGSYSDQDMFADSEDDEVSGPATGESGQVSSSKDSQSLRSYVSGDEECPEEDQVSSPQFRYITSKDDVDGDLPSFDLKDASSTADPDQDTPYVHPGDDVKNSHLVGDGSQAEKHGDSSEFKSSGNKSEASSLKESRTEKCVEAHKAELRGCTRDIRLQPSNTTVSEQCPAQGHRNKQDVMSAGHCSSGVEKQTDLTADQKVNKTDTRMTDEESNLVVGGDSHGNDSSGSSEGSGCQSTGWKNLKDKKRREIKIVNGKSKNGKSPAQNSCDEDTNTNRISEKDSEKCKHEEAVVDGCQDGNLDVKNTETKPKTINSNSKPVTSQTMSTVTSLISREVDPERATKKNTPTKGAKNRLSPDQRPHTPHHQSRGDKQQVATLISSDSEDGDADCRITKSFIQRHEQVPPDNVVFRQVIHQGTCCLAHRCPNHPSQNRISIDSGTIHKTRVRNSLDAKGEGHPTTATAVTEEETQKDSKSWGEMTDRKAHFASQRNPFQRKRNTKDISGWSDKHNRREKHDKDNPIEIMEDAAASQDPDTAADADVEDNEESDAVRPKSRTSHYSSPQNSTSREDRDSQSSSPEVIVIEDNCHTPSSAHRPCWISQNNGGGRISAPWIPSSEQPRCGYAHPSPVSQNKGFFHSHVYSPVKEAVVKAGPETSCCAHATSRSGQKTGHCLGQTGGCGVDPGDQLSSCCSSSTKQAANGSCPAKESECSPSPAKHNCCRSCPAETSDGCCPPVKQNCFCQSLVKVSECYSSTPRSCDYDSSQNKHNPSPSLPQRGSSCMRSSMTQHPKGEIYGSGTKQPTKPAQQKATSSSSPGKWRKARRLSSEAGQKSVKVNRTESNQTAEEGGSRELKEGQKQPEDKEAEEGKGDEKDGDSDVTLPPDSSGLSLLAASCVSVVDSSSSDSDNGDCQITKSFIHCHSHHQAGGAHQGPGKEDPHRPGRCSSTAGNSGRHATRHRGGAHQGHGKVPHRPRRCSSTADNSGGDMWSAACQGQDAGQCSTIQAGRPLTTVTRSDHAKASNSPSFIDLTGEDD